ncbi:hypothetical protein ABIE26_004260 [Pedobacter africanus]|uniref:Uncharacterized protein n=1 Tax=Pedobacter africanus TaxID=151894 RepID=A0ACC6L2A6_9SPHI|nr:hypothetical protein [Pedobacter africanus]MDR6785550.1 hypothetical protein [Pedobacter africanus]
MKSIVYLPFLIVLVLSVLINISCKEIGIQALKSETIQFKELANMLSGPLFTQNFDSSATVSDYVSTLPGTDQFNSIGTTGPGTAVSINNGKLRFDRTASANYGYFSRTTDFAPLPSVVQVSLEISTSFNAVANENTSAVLQLGAGFVEGVNTLTGTPRENNALVHSRLGIFMGAVPGQFYLRSNPDNTVNSAAFAGSQKITWVINNSDVLIRYTTPAGSQDLLSPDKWDLWVGTTKVYDEKAALTPGQSLSDLKFAYTTSSGIIDLDDVVVSDLSDLAMTPVNPLLIFNSGFEGTCAISALAAQTDQINGIDNQLSAPNNWQTDLAPVFNNFFFSYEGGDTTMRYARIVPDPVNPGNKVLKLWLAEANALNFSKGRVQANANNGNGVRELYQSVRMYLSSDFSAIKNWNQTLTWLTIFEFWNNNTWSTNPDPFRIKVDIVKPNATVGSKLNFRITGQTYDPGTDLFTDIWKQTNTTLDVPVGQWVTIDYYFKEGDAVNGRFYLAVTPDGGTKQVILDVNNCTHAPGALNPDGLKDLNPMKLYTSKTLIDYMISQGKVLQIYWDNFSLWKDKRP